MFSMTTGRWVRAFVLAVGLAAIGLAFGSLFLPALKHSAFLYIASMICVASTFVFAALTYKSLTVTVAITLQLITICSGFVYLDISQLVKEAYNDILFMLAVLIANWLADVLLFDIAPDLTDTERTHQ